MAIHLMTGKPGQGKSLLSAKLLVKTLYRNYKWYKKTKIIRQVWSNLKIQGDLEEFWHPFLRYWSDPLELVTQTDIDVFWDEIARHMDSRDWDKMPPELKTFLQEHDKVGINIYANTQAVMSVDVAFRRLCERMEVVTKIMGSRRPSPTKLPVRMIWGLLLIQELEEESFSKDTGEQTYKRELFSIPHFAFISKFWCQVYDTRQKIRPGLYPPLKHILRYCEDPTCPYHSKGMVYHPH